MSKWLHIYCQVVYLWIDESNTDNNIYCHIDISVPWPFGYWYKGKTKQKPEDLILWAPRAVKSLGVEYVSHSPTFIWVSDGIWFPTTFPSHVFWGPFHERFFHRNSTSMWMSFCSHPNCSEVGATKLCIWRACCAPVACGKLAIWWSYTKNNFSSNFEFRLKNRSWNGRLI